MTWIDTLERDNQNCWDSHEGGVAVSKLFGHRKKNFFLFSFAHRVMSQREIRVKDN